MNSSLSLQRVLETQIPLSKQMGIRVRACSSKSIRFALPIKPNRNHKKTGFGGTLIAAQALASWSLLMQILANNKMSSEVVLQREHSEFHRPVTADFIVQTRTLRPSEVGRFLRTLRAHKRARIEVTAQVICNRKVACEFSGQYVAIVTPPKLHKTRHL